MALTHVLVTEMIASQPLDMMDEVNLETKVNRQTQLWGERQNCKPPFIFCEIELETFRLAFMMWKNLSPEKKFLAVWLYTAMLGFC